MKINIIGTSGSGKSTLAKQIAARLGAPYIEMDTLYWRANWQGISDEEMFATLAEKLNATPDWVLDGNYNRTRPVKWQQVDIVVWIDYGFWRTLRQVTCRALKRAWHQQELWPGTGNRESLHRAFFSRESIILWMLKTWRHNRIRYSADMHNAAFRHIRFVHITTPAQARAFIDSLA